MINIPDKALVGKHIPKNRFTGKLRTQISEWIDVIVWIGKLSSETMNIKKSEDVPEIEIIELKLKEKTYKRDIVAGIEKVIPYPILFILSFDCKTRLVMSYKSMNNPNLYFSSEWNQETNLSLPYAIDTKHLLHELLFSFIPILRRKEETIDEIIERHKKITRLENDCIRLQKKIDTEKQPPKRISLNGELKSKKKELILLKSR